MKVSSTIILSILLSIMGFLGWYFGSNRHNYILTEKSLSHTPDLTLQDVSLLEFNATGSLARHIDTEKLVHIPHQDQYILYAPNINFYDEKNKLWHLVSNHAKTKHGFNTMIFQGQVVMSQVENANNNSLNLRTESLTYLYKKEQAFTNMPVELKQVGRIINAQGMQAYLKTNRILLHKAKAVMLPDSNV